MRALITCNCAHKQLSKSPTIRPINKCFLISIDARNDSISYVHYMYGQPNAAKTRHICKCNSFKGIKKLEMKSFEFLKNCEFCRLAKAKRNPFKGSVSRLTVLGKYWYADIKGPFEKPSLIHQNTYVFGIIEGKTRYLLQF